jgi:hypothetical protein
VLPERDAIRRICEAVASGRLSKSFRAADVNAALEVDFAKLFGWMILLVEYGRHPHPGIAIAGCSDRRFSRLIVQLLTFYELAPHKFRQALLGSYACFHRTKLRAYGQVVPAGICFAIRARSSTFTTPS